ncbi:Alcohol dehydrogenase superfamily, zinc-type [Penicillium expansum]|uniref:Alcohol dehydrogenase superfamily, zinc-type n=1 Tax=Penicillium expansum TaxID=27334 RepID=A0A0A2KJ97_PENEN|nr:Alcohol dehydrogenase superfamily, zinc-type [Penicillium expansum]KGO41499.1 Alcohol dehydrogenase superfamily, zinc-type [Penicillium expansum]KGO62481.1 Alcohol dehydrogenase superfamily, zinc-type [Penicillium expansum]KGO67023.1 Alcohol dehydrogenase superfamily, zinc-type [Penicillium expansum]
MSVPPIPPIQIAAVIASTSTPVSARVGIKSNRPVPTPGKGEILVKLEFSGVCHSDLHSIRGDTPMLTDVAGHEGVGKVVKVGPEVDEKQWMGTRCEICEINHTVCPYQKNAGANVPGTFQQYIVSPALHVTRIPEQLSPDSAAPLLCAGIAMYSSIMKTKTRPGDYLAILGAGGGLGHMGIQIAAKKGLKVIAIDSGDKKKQLCLSLGATEFLDYREVDIVQAVKAKTTFGVHAVICTANGERAYEQSMQMLRPFGTLVCVGIPNKPFKLPATPFDMIVKGLTIVGNSAGTADEMDEMLAMAVAGDVKAHIDVFELDDINDVLDRLERSEIDGRVVLRIPQ